jgi:sugar O-acyltransferase (sialic acid O-acetyltransferase NeuD family)
LTDPAKKALVWGASGHAAVVADAARSNRAWEIVGFIDELSPERRGEAFGGSVVVGGVEALEAARETGVSHVLLGVGNNRARLRIADEAERRGFALGTVTHARAIVAVDAVIGSGAFVAAGAVVNPGATVGRASIVNTNAVIEHHCWLSEGVHVAPGALLAGGVRVGRLTWIGIGAVVIEKLEIGEETMVGAGAVVVANVSARVVAYGVPASTRGSHQI